MPKHHPPHIAKPVIGPNAVTQLVRAAHELSMADRLDAIFDAAAARDWLITPPDDMVDEMRVARLHQSVRHELHERDAATLLARAGTLTGDYILAHRIPDFAKFALRILPRRFAALMLAKAIRDHAWTFAGSGEVLTVFGPDPSVIIADNPLCRNEQASCPVCVWHEAVLTTLFRALVSPRASVQELECAAYGGDACHFRIRYRRTRATRTIFAPRRSNHRPEAASRFSLAAAALSSLTRFCFGRTKRAPADYRGPDPKPILKLTRSLSGPALKHDIFVMFGGPHLLFPLPPHQFARIHSPPVQHRNGMA